MGVGKSRICSVGWQSRDWGSQVQLQSAGQPYGNLGEQLAQLQPKGPVLRKFLFFILGGLQLFA